MVSLPINNSVIFQVQNTSNTVTALNIQATLPAGWTDVSQTTMNCASVAPQQVCSIEITAGNSPQVQADVPLKGSNTNVALTQIEIIPTTTISSSVSNLNISVNDPALNPALIGSPRVITITNTGGFAAENLSLNVNSLPTGSTFQSTCGSTLVPSATCAITLTPGSSPSAAAGDLAPNPITIELTGANTNTLTLIASVLTYGSVVQGGYLFSVDDTTPDSGSIGGKVTALADQSSAVIWASNGSNAVSADLIPGIDETSTTSSGSPAYASAQVNFNSTYSNEMVFPFPPSGSFAACNGGTDGTCNSNNVLSLYNSYVTNFGLGGSPYSLSSGPTAAVQYAAGLCTATISGFSDWHLPAICEMGFDELGAGTGCGTSASPLLQNIQSNLVANGIVGLSGFYWSSTQYSASPISDALFKSFDLNNALQFNSNKGSTLAVRCTRALSP